MNSQTLSVPDISCEHCKTSIEGAVRPMTGVGSVEVHIDAKTVDVQWDASTIGLDSIVEAIEEQGYVVDGH